MPTFSDHAPAILQITIERIRAGGEARYGELEERIAEACARLDCPNNYLALESVAPPHEVWWLVEYASDAEVARVRRAYEQNQPLLRALTGLAALKKGIAHAPVEHMTRHRPELSVGESWRTGSEPFVAIATVAGAGNVFESEQHAMFTLVAAASASTADLLVARLGPSARVFRVRPSWSRPAASWVASNPMLWRTGSREPPLPP